MTRALVVYESLLGNTQAVVTNLTSGRVGERFSRPETGPGRGPLPSCGHT